MGRGSSKAGANGAPQRASNSALDNGAETITIQTYYRRGYRGSGSGFGETAYEAKESADGELVFARATPEYAPSRPQDNTVDVTFRIQNGYVPKRDTFYGINWDKVTSVSGDTYYMRDAIKDRGFTWDGDRKRWVKKK